MKARTLLVNLVALVALVAASAAARPVAPAPTRRPAVATTRSAPAVVRPAGIAGTTPAGGRTLADTHIEGEIAVPQVWFITARDQRRFMDFQHRRYLRSSRRLGEDTVLPARIGFLPYPTSDARKETPR